MAAPQNTDVAPKAWVEIGRVARARGLGGQLRVQLYGDDPANLVGAHELRLRGTPGTIPFRVEAVTAVGVTRDGRAEVDLSLVGLSARERAVLWAGAYVEIAESDLHALPQGEFYWRDLIGLVARTSDGEVLGKIVEIWPTGAHDVLVIRGAGGAQHLVPAIDATLSRVDLAAGEIELDWPEGVLDPEGTA